MMSLFTAEHLKGGPWRECKLGTEEIWVCCIIEGRLGIWKGTIIWEEGKGTRRGWKHKIP